MPKKNLSGHGEPQKRGGLTVGQSRKGISGHCEPLSSWSYRIKSKSMAVVLLGAWALGSQSLISYSCGWKVVDPNSAYLGPATNDISFSPPPLSVLVYLYVLRNVSAPETTLTFLIMISDY